MHSLNLFLALICVSAEEFNESNRIINIPEDDSVWVLSDSNFNDALDLQPNLLVEFYAPWCGHCKTLAPHYAKAASRLKDNSPSIRIAKVDATQNKNLAEKYGVTGYPTLKYFENKVPTAYDGGRTEDTIISWLLKKNGQSYQVINDYFQLQRRLDKGSITVVLFAQLDSPELKHFTYVSEYLEGVEFLISTDPVSLARFNTQEPSLILFKNFDIKRTEFSGNFKHSEIAKFIEKNLKSLVMEISQDNIEYMFDKRVPCLIVLSDKEDSDKYKEGLYKIAKKYENEMIFMYGDIGFQTSEKLRDYLGINPQDQPAVVVIDHKGEGNKYVNLQEPTIENMKSMIKSWKKKELKPHYKSELLPEKDYIKNVRSIVGSNFESVVFDKTKDVLVYFYSPYCSHCKDFEPVYYKIAKLLKSTSTLVLTKIDYTLNEVKDQKVSSFPSLRFYPGKNKKGIDYEGPRSEEFIISFLKEKANFNIDYEVKLDL